MAKIHNGFSCWKFAASNCRLSKVAQHNQRKWMLDFRFTKESWEVLVTTGDVPNTENTIDPPAIIFRFCGMTCGVSNWLIITALASCSCSCWPSNWRGGDVNMTKGPVADAIAIKNNNIWIWLCHWSVWVSRKERWSWEGEMKSFASAWMGSCPLFRRSTSRGHLCLLLLPKARTRVPSCKASFFL